MALVVFIGQALVINYSNRHVLVIKCMNADLKVPDEVYI
jgi:hypothetical protein